MSLRLFCGKWNESGRGRFWEVCLRLFCGKGNEMILLLSLRGFMIIYHIYSILKITTKINFWLVICLRVAPDYAADLSVPIFDRGLFNI